MPRDILDGIQTKRGRVVYDRPKHVMTDADRLRICGAVAPSADVRDIETSVDEAVSKILAILDPRAEMLPERREALYNAIAEVLFDGFSGGTFGGAGASRDV